MQAILDNTPGVSIEIEVFSSQLAALSPMAAGERVAARDGGVAADISPAVTFRHPAKRTAIHGKSYDSR